MKTFQKLNPLTNVSYKGHDAALISHLAEVSQKSSIHTSIEKP